MVSLALVIFVAGSAAAQTASPTYMLADWFPYGWMEDGKPRGLLVEIARAVDRALGVSHQLALAPVPRVLRSVKNGEYDFSIIYRGAKLNRQVEHVLDVGCIRTAAISMKTRPVRKLADMNGLRVAYSGSGYFKDSFLPRLKVEGVVVANADIMFRMALRGRLDAFVIDDAVWQGYRINLSANRQIPALRWQEFAEPYYLESLRLAISTPLNPMYKSLADRMKPLLGDTGFVRDLQKIYDRYGLPSGTACLHLSGNGIPG